MEERSSQGFAPRQDSWENAGLDDRKKTVKDSTPISAQIAYEAILAQGQEELRGSSFYANDDRNVD